LHEATRYHDFCAGHRVAGHENKCAHLHGHNYRVYFTCVADNGLDEVGRVIDFSVIKERLCEWLERNWDHKMLLWEQDELAGTLINIVPHDIVIVPFNPTAENMAEYMVEVIAPIMLSGTGALLVKCVVEETRKCSASYTLVDY
jgi:6-pyruvoyltetrahydropterin/6-carboxytetrahydropterin synthase